jgi:hypothetical protein
MENIIGLLEQRSEVQAKAREIRELLEDEITKTDMYQSVYGNMLGGEFQVAEKDARRHALSVCLKHFSKSTSKSN